MPDCERGVWARKLAIVMALAYALAVLPGGTEELEPSWVCNLDGRLAGQPTESCLHMLDGESPWYRLELTSRSPEATGEVVVRIEEVEGGTGYITGSCQIVATRGSCGFSANRPVAGLEPGAPGWGIHFMLYAPASLAVHVEPPYCEPFTCMVGQDVSMSGFEVSVTPVDQPG